MISFICQNQSALKFDIHSWALKNIKTGGKSACYKKHDEFVILSNYLIRSLMLALVYDLPVSIYIISQYHLPSKEVKNILLFLCYLPACCNSPGFIVCLNTA